MVGTLLFIRGVTVHVFVPNSSRGKFQMEVHLAIIGILPYYCRSKHHSMHTALSVQIFCMQNTQMTHNICNLLCGIQCIPQCTSVMDESVAISDVMHLFLDSLCKTAKDLFRPKSKCKLILLFIR